MIIQLCTGRKLNGLYLWLGIRLGFHQVVFEPHPKKLTVYLVPIGNNFFPLFLFPTVNFRNKIGFIIENMEHRTWFHGIIRMKRLYFYDEINLILNPAGLNFVSKLVINRPPQIKIFFFSLIFSIWCKVLNLILNRFLYYIYHQINSCKEALMRLKHLTTNIFCLI